MTGIVVILLSRRDRNNNNSDDLPNIFRINPHGHHPHGYYGIRPISLNDIMWILFWSNQRSQSRPSFPHNNNFPPR